MKISLSSRSGPRPRTTPNAPHSQIDQLPEETLSPVLIEALGDLAHVHRGESRRAPPGSIGFSLDPAHACGDARAFLLTTEFAHVHAMDDGSLHAILAEPLRSEAIEKGWAEPHPLAGAPTVSPDTVMIYAPRDASEVAIVAELVRASWRNAQKR